MEGRPGESKGNHKLFWSPQRKIAKKDRDSFLSAEETTLSQPELLTADLIQDPEILRLC